MKIRTFIIALSCSLLASTAPALARADTVTISDGDASFTLNGLIGNRLTASGGLGSIITQVKSEPADHLFQNWFWIRLTGDSREYALSNQKLATASQNRTRLIYEEPSNNGATIDALRVELEYTLTDLTGPRGPRVLLVIAFKLQNLTDSPLNVQLFSYNDLDLAADSANDAAVVSGSDDHVQLIDDDGGSEAPAQAVYNASSTNHIAYQIDNYPDLRDELTDAGSDSLSNSSSTFGPGDYSGANQWGVTLAAAGSWQDTLAGSVVLDITRLGACPADIVPNADVDIDDLFALIAGWGACP